MSSLITMSASIHRIRSISTSRRGPSSIIFLAGRSSFCSSSSSSIGSSSNNGLAPAKHKNSSPTTAPTAPTTNSNNISNYSRFCANLIMTGTATVRISDYDCVGFDLDNTLLRYRIGAMATLQYEALARFLVERKGYAGPSLMRPFAEQLDFLQRGLILDLRRGNVLKVSAGGYIRRAAHGTRFMSDAEVASVYGAERRWSEIDAYAENLLCTWEGPAAQSMRTLLDYFDLPLSLVFGRCVDEVDAQRGAVALAECSYDIWPDILDGVFQLYSREHFQDGSSPYFEALKSDPAKYIHPTSPKLIEYLRQLRRTRSTFLLTGSHIDFADFTATQALGANWRDLFDVVVCFAKKPGFFQLRRPFLRLDGAVEAAPIESAAEMRLNAVYAQGNWRDLMALMRTKGRRPASGSTAAPDDGDDCPKVLYVGDNLVQDVYSPFALSGCDTIAVVEELLAEEGSCSPAADAKNDDGSSRRRRVHDDLNVLCSQAWGSYFGSATDPTLWSDVIQRNAKLCVAEVADLADQPLDYEYKAFTTERRSCSKGFWPSEPSAFSET